ncbi:MAG TPA: patatin-like phospholipase family protein [Bacteroidales bacterium]|nr:patatin-like phospholipase family protein [Bacteroidales bacterium]
MKENVTLVLSGGGARGFAHIGAIEEIERRGYKICSIAGTSMGALIGGVYATGKLNEFKQWAHDLDKKEVLKLLDFSFSNQGLIKGDKVFKAMKKFIPDSNIEDLGICYTATAFDLVSNREFIFKNGSIYDAIRASISIPTVFTPVISDNLLLVDGGIVNNIPITNAIRSENDILIAVNVNAEIPCSGAGKIIHGNDKRDINQTKTASEIKRILFKTNTGKGRKRYNYFNLINSTINAATNYQSKMIIENNPPDILVEISRESCGIFDFFKAEEIVEIGRDAVKKKLDSVLLKT